MNENEYKTDRRRDIGGDHVLFFFACNTEPDRELAV
jgi:hypothetical protein